MLQKGSFLEHRGSAGTETGTEAVIAVGSRACAVVAA